MTEDFEDRLRDRVADVLQRHGSFTTSRIIGGGVGFMVDGKMCCGASRRGLVVRLGPKGAAAAAKSKGVDLLQLGNRTARGFVRVDPELLRTNDQIDHWVRRGIEFLQGEDAQA